MAPYLTSALKSSALYRGPFETQTQSLLAMVALEDLRLQTEGDTEGALSNRIVGQSEMAPYCLFSALGTIGFW